MKDTLTGFIIGGLLVWCCFLSAQMDEYSRIANIRDVEIQSYNHLNDVTASIRADMTQLRTTIPDLYRVTNSTNTQLDSLHAKLNNLRTQIDSLRAEMLEQSQHQAYDTGY